MADREPLPRVRRPDLTTGPIMRSLLLFALPTLGSNVLQSLNGSINAVWVGRYLGEGALAATSNANLVLFLTFAGVFGFGMAATILVGQSIGRGDLDGARRAMGSATGLFAGFSIAVALAGWWFSPAILRLLATPPAARPLAEAYLRVIFLGLPPGMLVGLIGMGLRGAGDSVTPLRFMAMSVLLDSGLNPVFIAGLGPAPRLGIAGSAVATLIANYATLGAMILYVYARDLPIRLRGRELGYLNPDPGLLRIIMGRGLPMALQMLMMSLSALFMIGLVNRHGTALTAAYGIAQQLWTYVQMPALAVGAAVSAMAAQNIGAGRWDRIARITRDGIVINLALTGTLVALLLLFDRPLFALFIGSGSPVVELARRIQLIGSWSFIVFGVTLVLFGVARANGAVWTPLVILTTSLFGIRLAFAYGLLPRIGTDAIWWSFPVGSVATVAMATLFYRSGRWRRGGIAAALERNRAEHEAHSDAEAGGRLNPTG